MALGYSSHRRPVEGRSIGLLEMDALGGPVEGRPSIKRIRRCSPNNTGVRGTTQGGRLTRGWRRNSLRCLLNETGGRMKQGGRLTSATRSLRSGESAVDTHEGKADESYERRFLWEGQSFSGSPVDKRPWQVDWTALPRHRFGGHWRWTRAVCIPGRNPVKFLHSPSSPKVGPKLGEQCRTQVPTSAGSGNLQPTLDEEPCAPSGARSACCLPLHWTVLHSLGERCDRVPGVPPVVLGDHAHHQVSPQFPNCTRPAATTKIDASLLYSALHCPSAFLHHQQRLLFDAHDGYDHHCIQYKRSDNFPPGSFVNC